MAKMFRVYGSVIVQQATKVELFVNLKTAKALDLTVPLFYSSVPMRSPNVDAVCSSAKVRLWPEADIERRPCHVRS